MIKAVFSGSLSHSLGKPEFSSGIVLAETPIIALADPSICFNEEADNGFQGSRKETDELTNKRKKRNH